MICNICCNEKTNFCECPECKKSACTKCIKTHIMNPLQLLSPTCMFCHIGWPYDFIRKTLGKSFTQRYTDAVTELLYTKETALLPQTKVLAEKVKRRMQKQNFCQKIHGYRINNIIIEVLTKYEKREEGNAPKFYGFCPVKNCEGTLTEAFTCSLCKKQACIKCRKEPHGTTGTNADMDSSNECQKEDIETAQQLEKSRPCPSCSTPIEKASGGCDEMFCVKCHTSFSWRTGTVIKKEKTLHNPHHSQWLQETKQEPAPKVNIEEEIIKLNNMKKEITESKARFMKLTTERLQNPRTDMSSAEKAELALKTLEESDKLVMLQPAARKQNLYVLVLEAERDNRMLVHLLNKSTKKHPQYSSIGKMVGTIDRIQYDYLPMYQTEMQFTNTDLRIKLLLGRINTERFRLHLRLRFLFKQRMTSIHMILSSFVESANRIFNRVLLESEYENEKTLVTPDTAIDKMLNELEALREHTETSLKNLQLIYFPAKSDFSLNLTKTWDFSDRETYNEMGILKAHEHFSDPIFDLGTIGPFALPPGTNPVDVPAFLGNLLQQMMVPQL